MGNLVADWFTEVEYIYPGPRFIIGFRLHQEIYKMVKNAIDANPNAIRWNRI